MADKNEKPTCKYGTSCYQRNQAHKDRFSHPSEDKPDEIDRTSSSPEPPTKKRKSPSKENSDNESRDVDENIDEIESSSNGSSLEKEISIDEATALGTEMSSASNSVGARCSEFIYENFDKGPHSHRAEYLKLLESPAEFISEKFLVTMPADFFALWEFCELESKKSELESYFNKFGLHLVGPFDVLAKKFHGIQPFEPGYYLRHWRFYYDPPEFQVKFQ